MSRSRKSLIALAIVVLLLLSTVVTLWLSVNYLAYAAEKEYFSAEQYTNSDNLLKPDGTESSRDIKKFAEGVKAGKHMDVFNELEQVIPLQYLKSKVEK